MARGSSRSPRKTDAASDCSVNGVAQAWQGSSGWSEGVCNGRDKGYQSRSDYHNGVVPEPWYINQHDLVLEPSSGAHCFTLVLLHSCSGGPDDWLPFIHRMSVPFRNKIRIVVPCAPVRHEEHAGWIGEQNSWFEYAGDGERAKDVAQLTEQRVRLSTLVAREKEKLPGKDGRRLILAGLSQGVALAVDVALRTPFAIGGVVALRGMVLLDSLDQLPALAAPFELLAYHGERDNQCPVEQAKAGYESLQNFGVTVHFLRDVALGHACARGRQRLCAAELREVCAFLKKVWGTF